MTLSTFWWSPSRDVRSAGGEAVRHTRAWTHLLARGGGRLANFGDEVSPWLVEELTGRRPRWSPVDRADLICVGSIVDVYARKGGSGRILGSGIREPETAAVGAVDLDRVLLVRGQLTRQALGAPEVTPLGDPGLAISTIAPAPAGQRGGVVVVPHFAALGQREVRQALDACRGEGWRVVLPNRPPLEVAAAISGADLVVTSSLHGLVFADAYGVPAQLVTMVDGPLAEPGFKYEDYGSALDVSSHTVALAEVVRSRNVSGWIEQLERRTAGVAARLEAVLDAIHRAARQLR